MSGTVRDRTRSSPILGPADYRLNTVVLPKKERNGTVSDRRIVSQSQSQLIVGGTLIRRSPLGATDTQIGAGPYGHDISQIPLLVRSLV